MNANDKILLNELNKIISMTKEPYVWRELSIFDLHLREYLKCL